MKSYIKEIIIFNKDGEKRTVPLQPGVNIITGESKTGKSALVEIIDYCLCSTRCTIPKGKITDFAHLYVLVMVIGDFTYIIGRQNWDDGAKMYFCKENINYKPINLELTYFNDKKLLFCRDAKSEIECALGLFVTNMGVDADQVKKRASLRNMVSYMFQHQNLMASKFALFYRFADYYKRKDVIEQFPVFAGMISQEYYSDLIRLNTLNIALKQKQKKQKDNEKSTLYIKENLLPLMRDYFSLIGKEFDDGMSAQKMLNLASNLPEFDESQLIEEEKITIRYRELETTLEKLRDEERDILLQINNLENISNTGASFFKELNDLKEQTSVSEILTTEYTCPICGHDCKEISEKDFELVEATEWLETELLLTEKYTADFSEDLRTLKDLRTEKEGEIKEIWKQIKTIKEKYISSKEFKTKIEKVNYAKARITLYAEMSNSGIFESVDEDIAKLEEEIRLLDEKIKGFDVDAKKAKAQAFLSENMNRLAQTLDFEEEYRPLNLNFGLLDESFDIYQHQNDREKIHLYEMGSGANWVSCHIALFLSFLRYFAMQEKSPMPLIMFFDQPSQVYFPQGNFEEGSASQADLMAVHNMYKTIFDEINSIGKDTGVSPQIIIVDHVDGSSLECKDEFKKYVRRNWRGETGLI